MKDQSPSQGSAATAHRIAEHMKRLGENQAELETRLQELTVADQTGQAQAANARKLHAVTSMRMISRLCCQTIDAQKHAVHAARYALRRFMADVGIYRPLQTPNVLLTLLVVMLGTLFEAVFTTISLFADGHLDLIPAMGFALTFAIVTTVLGLTAGSCLRFVSYRSTARIQTPDLRPVRWLARSGFVVLVCVTLLMVFVGGRVRVTGQHQDIFNFSDIGFAATFGDGMALVIMVAASLSFILSVTKGYSGFSDPIPGYAAYVGRTDVDHGDEIGLLVADTLDQIDEIFAAAEEDLLDGDIDPDDIADLRADILQFNAAVIAGKAELKAIAKTEWEQDCFATGLTSPQPEIDLHPLDALILDPDRLPDAPSRSDLIDALLQAQAEVHAEILAAQADFTASLQSFRVTPPST